MNDKVYCGVWVVIVLIMLLYYSKRRKPLRSALFGMITGLAALVLCSIYGEPIAFTPEINTFNTMIALILGVPGVILLYLSRFV